MQSGFINVYKTSGMTSQRVVSQVKRLLRNAGVDFGDKVGHLGTLDPDAEGVLPIAFGRATRLFDYFLDKVKVYYTVFKFGLETDTLDASGSIISEDPNIDVEIDKIELAIPKLIGKVAQIPPLYSAKSIGGVRAYALARNGQSFDIKPKDVDIYSIESLGKQDKNTFAFRITCGGGTYIRSIARDMAYDLDTVGIMQYLRRESSGGFGMESAKTIEKLQEDVVSFLLPLEFGLSRFPIYSGDSYAEKLLNGVPVYIEDAPNEDFVLYLGCKVIGICKKDELGNVKIATRLL